MGNSTNQNQFPLFDDIESEAEKIITRIQDNIRAWMSEPVPCHFCGERMNRGIMEFNHRIVFNGWCMKALMYHLRSKGRLHTHTEEARWLESKGIDPKCDKHDQRNWRPDLIKQHYEGHYGNCYTSEDCK